LRLIPSFSFGYGVLNIGNRSLYAQKDKLDQPYSTFDMNIAGGDVLFLALEGVCYMLLIFLYENLSHRKGFSEMLSGESKVAYVPKEYDDDVQREMETIAKVNYYFVLFAKIRHF
jgi:ATP-binding cassette subfamily A (ABC1) protein 3